jgi:flagellar biosynthesis protein FlhA
MPSSRLARLAVPVVVVLVVIMMVVPLPAALLDVLIAANIAMSLLVLLVALQVRRPLDFAVFPTIVLVGTILRLALNVSSTRLVLRDGYAGNVIEAFGHIVIGGSLVIGLVVFAILVIIQLTVVTNGAARVAEVGARFTLDAMPGKQMAIDADLNSGLIDEDEARRRRKDVAAEADFYGAMDGGTKFVKGDAIAAIIITLVNLVGGFAVGMLQKGMSPGDAINTYALLSVGDGLVSQVPALLMSVATGVIVTRATSDGDVGNDLVGQLTRHREALRIAGAALIALCLVPGMPKLPFVLAGGVLLFARPAPPRPTRSRMPTAPRRPCRREPPPSRNATPSPSPCTSTRSSSCWPRTSSTSSTPPAAATCSTGCARYAARPRSTSGSCCPRCAPGPAARWRPAATRSGSAA